jgi:hypothetical protein
MKLLANPLSQQAGKWLVIRRRPESSVLRVGQETAHPCEPQLNQLDTGFRRCDDLFGASLAYKVEGCFGAEKQSPVICLCP